MRAMPEIRRAMVCLCLAAAMGANGFGESPEVGGPFTAPLVTDAPFSADATTIAHQTLDNGTRIGRSGKARYYRDRAGRIRVEQVVPGADARNPFLREEVRITIHADPVKQVVHLLEPRAQTYSRGSRATADVTVGGGDWFTVPLGWTRFLVFGGAHRLRQRVGIDNSATKEESLGRRRMEGVEVVGRRITTTIPARQWNNDGPIQVVEERWESPELQVAIYCRLANPRTGDVEYRLTNIDRAEPPQDLFAIPADYTIGTPTEHHDGVTLEYADPPRDDRRAAGGRRR